MPPTITTRRGAWHRRWRMSSPFVAAAACEALRAAGADSDAFETYLRATREPEGSWLFEPERRRWPPDADTTACAIAALPDDASILGRIVEVQPDGDGLIRPWLLWHRGAAERMDRNASDAIVTANVVFAARRAGIDCSSLLAALERHVGANGLEHAATVYYDSPALRAYYLARAAADGPIGRAVLEFVAEATSPSGVDAAATLAAAALVGAPTAPLAEAVHAGQQRDGGWPESRWFTDPANYVWQSRTFSTALAVEALALTATR
jgi:hypothetical protein